MEQKEKITIEKARIHGQTTQMSALASEAIDKLTRYISKATPQTGVQLGSITQVIPGPPMTTLTVSLNGEDVPNIRFISNGVTPSVGDIAVVITRGNTYICIGVLA